MNYFDKLIFGSADKPSAPRNLQATNIEHDNVTLAWDAPTSTGGSPITGYAIEKRDAARTNWMGTGNIGPDRCEYNASRLFEGNEYFFRVAAENVVGTSDFVELDTPVVPKLPYSKFYHNTTAWFASKLPNQRSPQVGWETQKTVSLFEI